MEGRNRRRLAVSEDIVLYEQFSILEVSDLEAFSENGALSAWAAISARTLAPPRGTPKE
jgi:hypothetical protein